MKRSAMARWLAPLALLGLFGAACGDDSATGASTATTAAPAATTTVAASGATGAGTACDASKPTIKVGGLGQAQFFPGMDDGIRARLERENKTCIQGRKLEFVGLKDDASDAQKNLDLAKGLVESDKVFAIITTSAVLLQQTTNYLDGRKVPYFGWGFMPGFCGKDSWGYGFNGCLSGYSFDQLKAVSVPGAKINSSLIDPVATLVKKANDKFSIVIFNSDDDSGHAGDVGYTAMFNKDQVLDKRFVPTQGVTDYTQYVNIVKDKKPDAVMLSTDFATAIKLKAAIVQSGYTGIVYDYTTYVPGLLDASKDTAAALEGGYSNTQFPIAEEGKIGTKQIADDLTAIGKPPFVTQGASIGYWSSDLMIQMLKSISGDITPDNFRKVAEGGFTYKTVDGGIGEIKYPEGHFNAAPCSGMVQVKAGKYVPVVPFKCYTLLEPKK
jgi:ABC-type branched-subunit amino acid transport system substrate-binding protein